METEQYMNGHFITTRLLFLKCLTVVIIVYFLFIIPTSWAAQSQFAFVWWLGLTFQRSGYIFTCIVAGTGLKDVVYIGRMTFLQINCNCHALPNLRKTKSRRLSLTKYKVNRALNLPLWGTFSVKALLGAFSTRFLPFQWWGTASPP